jgi:hypothetical protein
MWRKGLDQATPGLSNALAFLSQASSITSVLDVLTNDTNFEVITAALGLPQSIVFLDEAGQKNAISSHLDISKLQDRHYVTSLTDQYLVTMQAKKASSTPSKGSILDGLAVQAGGLVV